MRFLPYVPLALAVLLALVVPGIDDPIRRQSLTGAVAGLLGATMALLGARAIARGRILVRSRVAERRRQPLTFWVTVAVLRFGLAAIFFAAAAWYLR